MYWTGTAGTHITLYTYTYIYTYLEYSPRAQQAHILHYTHIHTYIHTLNIVHRHSRHFRITTFPERINIGVRPPSGQPYESRGRLGCIRIYKRPRDQVTCKTVGRCIHDCEYEQPYIVRVNMCVCLYVCVCNIK
jgi:hypothetical protein